MRPLLTCLAIFFGCLGSELASGHETYEKYFPIKKGNAWRYKGVKWADESTIEVAKAGQFGAQGPFALWSFPGTELGVWGRFAGSTSYARQVPVSDTTYAPFLRFGAPVGTKYHVDLGPDYEVDHRFKAWLTVESKMLKVQHPYLNQTFKHCVSFLVSGGTSSMKGLSRLVFAPTVGLILWSTAGVP
jgi:hypothetical protein